MTEGIVMLEVCLCGSLFAEKVSEASEESEAAEGAE
jgi:hypothetical protein